MIQKKIRSLIYSGLGLVLCVLLCGGIGMTAQAAETKTYEGFTYAENESGITITGYTGDKTELVIPGKIDGKKVTSIGKRAFEYCRSLTSITIPAGVTSIGCWAFSDCYGLTSITIPASVTSIEWYAFASCRSLKSIMLPKGVTSIESGTFNGCMGLKSITIPASVTSIGDWAFSGCDGLTSITIPKGVTSIGHYAFNGCRSLTSITISKGVTKFGGDGIFEGCHNLVIFCYKDSDIYKYAINNNISVKIIPETEDPWGDGKKEDPKPNNIKPAKKGTTFTVSSKKLKVRVTSSSKKNPTVTITKFTDKKAKKLTIPATVKVKDVTYKVTAVSDKAFKGNKKLTTVTIGSNVTKIGKEAFSGCKNLKKITVTAGKLKTIGKNAFKGINKKATITVKGTKKAKTALKKQLKKKSIGYVKTWKIK